MQQTKQEKNKHKVTMESHYINKMPEPFQSILYLLTLYSFIRVWQHGFEKDFSLKHYFKETSVQKTDVSLKAKLL